MTSTYGLIWDSAVLFTLAKGGSNGSKDRWVEHGPRLTGNLLNYLALTTLLPCVVKAEDYHNIHLQLLMKAIY